MEENKDASELFKRFEPKIYGKEEYHIFNGFTPYREEEIDILLGRIKKVHLKEKLENEDYQLLKVPEKLPKAIQTYKENLFMLTSPQTEHERKFGQDRTSLRTKYSSNTLSHIKSSELLLHDKINTVKLPRCPSGSFGESYLLGSKSKKMRFNNIIIIVTSTLIQKGRTITKREIFDLRDYFDKLSSGKECILI